MASPKVRKERLNSWGLRGGEVKAPQWHRSRSQFCLVKLQNRCMSFDRFLSCCYSIPQLIWAPLGHLPFSQSEDGKGSSSDFPIQIFQRNGFVVSGIWDMQTGKRSTMALHSVIADVHTFLPSVPLPLMRDYQHLVIGCWEELYLIQILNKCPSMSEWSHGNVEDMANGIDGITGQPEANALFSERFFINTDLTPPKRIKKSS